MQEIIINQDKNNSKEIALVENGILIEYYKELENQNRLEGNIYLGKVQNVLPGMQAAFVNIGENRNAFMHLKDILPKIDLIKPVEEKNKNIKDLIKAGDRILVQVKRDASSKKGGRVSTHINLSGRFIVLMPNTDIITISQKIEKETERTRLLEIVKQSLPEGFGAIIRTSSMGKKKDEIEKDIVNLLEVWKQIKKKEKSVKEAPKLLQKNEDLIGRFFTDIIDHNISKVMVNKKELQLNVSNLLNQMQLTDEVNVELIRRQNILDIYNVQKQIDKLNSNKVWLKCGGFITIDKTEALIAIDVNTGKYTGSKSLEQTVFNVNKEATIEIAKQLRLRDLSGIIIIDFIDMKNKKHKEQIEQLLKDALKKDRSKTQVFGFTHLNLLELTRKHILGNNEVKEEYVN